MTTRGRPMSEDLGWVMKASQKALELDAAKRKTLDYVQSRMSPFAPTLSVLIGTQQPLN